MLNKTVEPVLAVIDAAAVSVLFLIGVVEGKEDEVAAAAAACGCSASCLSLSVAWPQQARKRDIKMFLAWFSTDSRRTMDTILPGLI